MDFLRPPIVLCLALVFSMPLLSAENDRPQTVNPALIYWQAFSLMGELSRDESKTLNELLNHRGVFDTTKSTAILATHNNALKRFRKATTSTSECDWGLTYEDGPFLPLPHVTKLQMLCRLGLLKSKQLFSEQNTAEAIDWLFCVHHAARHCGAGDLIIPILGQFTIEQLIMHVAAAHVLDWNESTRVEYLSRWNSLPPLHTVSSSVKGELQYIDWLENFWMEHDKNTLQPELIEALTNRGNAEEMTAEEKAATEDKVTKCTPENIKKWFQEIRELYLKMQSAMNKPWREGNAELIALQSEDSVENNLMLRLSTPTPFHKVNDISFKTATYQTMLKAALEHGSLLDESNIKTYADSFSGSPLTLKKSPDYSLTISTDLNAFTGAGKKIELRLGVSKNK